MSKLITTLRSRLVKGRRNDWQTYHDLVARHLRPGMRVLVIGCGRGDVAPFPWEDFPYVRLTGLDPDPRAKENPFLDNFVCSHANEDWPIPGETADLALCRYVLEHVEKPARFLRNVHRVLKPGCAFILLTPNIRHPLAMISRCLPCSVKQRLLAATKGVPKEHVFPTFYRMNSPPRLRRLAIDAGFGVQTLLTKEFTPSAYLDFSLPGFLLAWAYFEIVSRSGWESRCGAQMIGLLEKPARCASG